MPKVRIFFILKLFLDIYVYCEDLQNGTASSLSDTKRKLYPNSLQDNTSQKSQSHISKPGFIPGTLMSDVLSNLHKANEMGSLMDALQAATTKSIVVAFAKHCANYTAASNNHVVNKLRYIMQNNINVIIHRLTKSMAEFVKKTDKYASEMPFDFCDEGQEYVVYNRIRCLAGDESCLKEFSEVATLRTPDDVISQKNCAQTSDPSLTRRRNMPPKIQKKVTSSINYEDIKDIEKAKHRYQNDFNRDDLSKYNLKPQFSGTDGGSFRSSSIEIQENNPNIIENSNIRNEKLHANIVPAEEEFPAVTPQEDEPLHNKYKGDKATNDATYEYDTDNSDAIRSKSNFVPKTVKLSKDNKDFYNDRKWPGGVVRYMIGNEEPKYDIADLRKRLNAVNEILKEKTCVRLVEISQKAKERYNDYIVLDTSPDYITGRVGKEQHFGSIELFEGGQHRQHTAMMVMAMLGFYFECARHDRDDYVRVHIRHIRPEKLHHFERIRKDATFALPYDFKSATHPAWQFWRKLGKTGISTVATYKVHDPDGAIMNSMGQNEDLLSDLDIVKINSVYGTKCFRNFRKVNVHLDSNGR